MMLITTCLFLLLATSVYSRTTGGQTSTASTPPATTASSIITAPLNCDDLASIEVANGTWKNTNGSTTVNSTATLECNSGYAPSSNNTTIICQYNGTWNSSAAPICEVRDCGGLASIKVANGIWKNTTGSTTVNSTATLECHSGYEPSSNNTTIICQNNGTWSSSAAPICKVRDCGGLASIEVDNGIWKNTTGSTTVNSTATLECHSGYEPSSNNTTIICQNNGTWNSSAAPICKVRDCGFPFNTSVINGTWNTTGSTTVNSTATLVCYPGYEPSNTSLTNISCQDDGRWNNLTATCQLMKLAYNETCYINNPAQCRSQNATCKNMTVGGNWRCQCSSVFFTFNNTTDNCAPDIPEDVKLKVGDVNNTFITLTLNVCSNSSHTYSAHIYPSNNTTKHEFNCSTKESPENQTSTTVFKGLSSGTQYTFILVLSVDGVTSRTIKTIVSYTKPHTPDFVNLSSIKETTLNITWGFSSAQVGQYYGFSISVSPDIGRNITLQSNTTTNYTLENLKGGTIYSVSVSSLLGNLSSEMPQTASDCTYPTPPNNGYIFRQEIDSIEIRYNITGDIIDMYSIVYNGSNFTSTDSEETTRVLTISGLQQGSNYTFNVSSLTCGKQSLGSETIETFTRPGPPSSININEQTETTLTVKWSAPSSGGVNSYRVWLRRQGQETDSKMETNNVSCQFENLTAGTDYTVYVQTVWRGLNSTETSISTYTAPATFIVSTTGITERTLNFSATLVFEQYIYTFILTDTVTNINNTIQGPAVQFTGLVSGRLYRITVIATVGGVESIYPKVVLVNTRPSRVENITLLEDKTTNTTMTISWRRPRGDFDYVTVNFNCTGPNRGSLYCSQRHDNGTTSSNCSGLDPGTFCQVEIYTQSGYQSGETVILYISSSTQEEAPSSVIMSKTWKSSRAINVTWSNPSTLNGIIRKYRVILEDLTEACNNTYIVREIKCSDCPAENASLGGECKASSVEYLATLKSNEYSTQTLTDTTNASFLQLVPGRNYTITVIAYTKCWGPATVISVRTDEEEPTQVTNIIVTKLGMVTTLAWETPCPANGFIIQYKVTMTYKDAPELTFLTETNAPNITVPGLKFDETYVFSVAAINEAGIGRPVTFFYHISGEPDEKTGVPLSILIVTAAAVLVSVVVGIIVIIMKRKQMGCFGQGKHTQKLNDTTDDNTIEMTGLNSVEVFLQPTAKVNFPGHVNVLQNGGLFSTIFKMIERNSAVGPSTYADKQINQTKNSSNGIRPYDQCRVQLSRIVDHDSSDYINASFIPGCRSDRAYIASQNPLNTTMGDFWRMVCEQNVATIVMMSLQGEKESFAQYWPNIKTSLRYGEVLVSNGYESHQESFTVRIMRLKMASRRQTVRQFEFKKWTDVSNDACPKDLLHFVQSIRKDIGPDTPNSSPIIVHCSNGSGATGTFIAVDYLLQHIRDQDDIDIYNLVLEMRRHRSKMVQTEVFMRTHGLYLYTQTESIRS